MQSRIKPLLLIGDAKYVIDDEDKIVAGPFLNSVRTHIALDGSVAYSEYTDAEEAEKNAWAVEVAAEIDKRRAKIAAAHRLGDLSPKLENGSATPAERDEALVCVSKLFVGGKRS